MRIGLIGTGYVGLVIGTCLANFGWNVTCSDNNIKKLNLLVDGHMPFFEPNLEDIVKKSINSKRLKFNKSIKDTIKHSDIIFVAVGTPSRDDGSTDIKEVIDVASELGEYINEYKIVVIKSTVPIGTWSKVRDVIQEGLDKRKANYNFDIVSNPEFLREGSAVHDFNYPDRIILGSKSLYAIKKMKELYCVLSLRNTPIIETNNETAEMIKYAANAFLAMKVTYINELANLCEKIGVDVTKLAEAVGKDSRIGEKFLNPGPGYGGSCLPKDTKSLVSIARSCNSPVTLIEQTIKANNNQKLIMATKVIDKIKDGNIKAIAVLGLTFKANTDDIRESPSLTIISKLLETKVEIKVFDPIINKKKASQMLGTDICLCQDEYEAAQEVDAVVIITEWDQFRNLDLSKLYSKMQGKYFFDYRNMYVRKEVELQGFAYYGVGT